MGAEVRNVNKTIQQPLESASKHQEISIEDLNDEKKKQRVGDKSSQEVEQESKGTISVLLQNVSKKPSAFEMPNQIIEQSMETNSSQKLDQSLDKTLVKKP